MCLVHAKSLIKTNIQIRSHASFSISHYNSLFTFIESIISYCLSCMPLHGNFSVLHLRVNGRHHCCSDLHDVMITPTFITSVYIVFLHYDN